MDLLPIFLNIRDRKCVIVGGGEVALRKATLLTRAHADLHIVSKTISQKLQNWCDENSAAVAIQPFQATCLQGAALVIAATDDKLTNEAVSKAAGELGIPVNVVDQPELSSFILPAIVDRTPVLIAISSGGTSPVLTRKLKELNEAMVPGRIDKLARLLGSYRSKVKSSISEFSQRLRFWEEVLESEIPELVYSGNEDEAVRRIDQRLGASDKIPHGGEVYLVGAGPGDPDLLTLRALRLMHKADVVLYDRLVSAEIMQKLRPDAVKIHVGKERAKHSVGQESINEMLVRLAQEGKKVLRLKGGDPFIFGRGGEELETLAEAGVPFQVVPGITAASGCAAYAGIPLTHRDYAQSVRFLAGHLKDGALDLDWSSLAKGQQTLVFYMGLIGLSNICQQLIAHGMDAATPIAVIQRGTTADQKVICGNLSSMPGLAESNQIKAPTITIVGEVVKLRERLSWYQS
ncbi:MAG: uroporphyrinogen-III C-methyltransferase [Proteobacteria bacterium]|nr:uroporphyrinogen-III C-methyltransferase [Pseudomonadota bacterium]